MVVGAGIAGATCARALQRAGVGVRVLERGRRVGGRMASRRIDGRPVDLGASYLTVSDDMFAAVVHDWADRGLARPWTDTFAVAGGHPRSGPVRWGAPAGLRSLVEDLVDGLDVRLETPVSTVRRNGSGWLVDGIATDAVVLAMPDPQARRLLAAELADALPADASFEPVLALAARWPERVWDFDGLFVNDHPVLDWVADDGRRRGDDAPVLVAHSGAAFAARHLDDPQAAGPELADALAALIEAAAPSATVVHRWTFAKPSGTASRSFALVDRLGLCGDRWSEKPRVEAAYLSGRALAGALLDQSS
ncbi:MAG TPA: FAD-dependent oxidoreductase [Microlunatus sp.]|nr:FAD-dependent oxidoreductase [Microlunatus sp.]